MKEIILKDTVGQGSNIDFSKELNQEQLKVVLHADGPCLVLAGAGSGKTRTITYRVAYLLEHGVSADNILLLTFTNKAAKEMMSRVETLLGSYPVGLWGGTFHSVANKILRLYADGIGYTSKFSILDSEDSESLIKSIIKELGVDTSERRFPSAAKLHGMISYARNAGRTIADVIEHHHEHFFNLIPTIECIAEVYEIRKRQADAMDFDDLLIRLRDLLREQPGVCNRLATQFEYMLVDEYQDTNVLQAELIRMLSSVHKNILVVGDDAQSIYSFRAAEIKNILSFPNQYGQTKTFRLVTNYRSSPEILMIANASIKNNRQQFEKELSAMRSNMEKPQLVPANTTSQEAQFIAQQILTLHEQGIPFREIAVLFRAAFHSQALEFELMRRDIAYEYRGGLKFFERAHVKDLIMFLRLCANIKDEVAWMRVLGLQTGIGLVTAQKMFAHIREYQTLKEVANAQIGSGSRAVSAWKTLAITLAKLAESTQPSHMIRQIIAGDYRDYLEAEYQDFMDRLEDIEQFAIFADQYKDLTSFLADVSLTSDYGVLEEETHGDEERVILSTVHQAKGLEWDAVFVMNLVDGKFPNGRALEERDGLEEERRLFYVATTRARKFLTYTYPQMSDSDTMLLSHPSMFLQELDPDLLETVRLKRAVSTSWHRQNDKETKTVWNEDDGYEEASIDVDTLDESIQQSKKSPGSFLRDI